MSIKTNDKVLFILHELICIYVYCTLCFLSVVYIISGNKFFLSDTITYGAGDITFRTVGLILSVVGGISIYLITKLVKKIKKVCINNIPYIYSCCSVVID